MKNLLLLSTILICAVSSAQAVLEHSYWTSQLPEGRNYFYTEDGLKYLIFDGGSNIFQIFNDQHILLKTFTAPFDNAPLLIRDIFVTDKLFNNDSKIEFLVSAQEDPVVRLLLFDDDGNILQEFPGRRAFKILKNNDNEYKLITTDINPFMLLDFMDVYSLIGTLSVNQQNLLRQELLLQPNPASDFVRITNNLQSGQTGVLSIFTLGGAMISQKTIHFNDEIQLDVSSFASGTYLYNFNGDSGKFIKK